MDHFILRLAGRDGGHMSFPKYGVRENDEMPEKSDFGALATLRFWRIAKFLGVLFIYFRPRHGTQIIGNLFHDSPKAC